MTHHGKHKLGPQRATTAGPSTAGVKKADRPECWQTWGATGTPYSQRKCELGKPSWEAWAGSTQTHTPCSLTQRFCPWAETQQKCIRAFTKPRDPEYSQWHYWSWP